MAYFERHPNSLQKAHKTESSKFLMLLLTIIALMAILSIPVTAANVTKVEIRGTVFDEKSAIYNTTLAWNATNFAGFWYNFVGGTFTEYLTINQNASNLTNASRIIEAGNLSYKTSRSRQNYTVFSEKGLKVEKGLEYNGSSSTKFTNSPTGACYARLGWFGELYIALNGKANKLTKLIMDQKKSEKKTLMIGETWDLGEGFSLTANSIDAKASPRQAHLIFSKDGIKLDDKIILEGQAYTYIQDIGGEKEVPAFVTYAESIFAGATSDMLQLKYTWLISQKVTVVKTGDTFGILEVMEATEDYILLNNSISINLNPNNVFDLGNEFKLKVADSSTTLRFYPVIEKTLPGKYEVRGGVYEQSKYTNLNWDAQQFSGFWYNFVSGKSSENLNIDQNASNLNNTNRIIEAGNLTYKTSRTDQTYTVSKEKGIKVTNGLEYNSTNRTFTRGITGSYYARLGWFGTLYTALNGKANKLTKLVKEQTKSEKQTLTIGETWDLGEGFSLTAQAIDAKASPRQAHLIFSKDGIKLDDKVILEGQAYSYVQSLSGEIDVPVFVTYAESIFAGATTDMVQLKYTWLISRNVIEIRTGDTFGNLEAAEATEDYLLLQNPISINLNQNAVLDLGGDMKLKVADSSSTLRFYPYVEYTIPGTTSTSTVTSNSSIAALNTTTNVTASTTTLEPVISATEPASTASATTAPSTTEQKKGPGFEAVISLAGLLTVAFFVHRKRE